MREAGGNTYVYVQVHASSTSAIAAYSACYRYAAATPWVVNSVATLLLGNLFTGIGIGDIAKGSYGWVLYSGDTTSYIDEASTATTMPAGAPVYPCSTDKAVACVLAGTSANKFIIGYLPIGFTTAATVSSVSTVKTVTMRIR